ncbi:MAG TPA: DUF1360 domain-containing protein [Nocardioides sp.]|uniref:DUF1360 domain-containing protein n=1 Tax=Nocardioides sp. TaxID=35761 RepID=UPI002F3FE60F
MSDDTPRSPHRIAGYLGMLSLFGGALASAAAVGRSRGQHLPDDYGVQDLVLGALATHKFSRLVAKDGVTTPVRAPFTEFEENAGSAEVNESPKEGHLQHVPGEVLTCPFCLAPWVATSYVVCLTLSPRLARAWAATFAIVGGSDWLQHGYSRIRAD